MTSARSLNRRHRAHGDAPVPAPPGRRASSGRALALPVAFLLAGSSLLLVHPEPTSLPVPEVTVATAASVDLAAARREGPPNEPITVATTPRERIAGDADAALDSPRPIVVVVSGTLRDPAHAPIRGAGSAVVEFVDHTGRRRSADAKHEGAYALHALDAGTYWVTASADGYRSLEETVELRPDETWMRKDFTLQPAVQLRVRVTTPDGRNLVDALAARGAAMGALLLVPVATREPPGQRCDGVVGNGNGTFGVGSFLDHGPRVQQLAAGCIGILLLDCDLPVCVSLVHNNVVLETQRVDRGQDEVIFVLSPDNLTADLATIRAQVVDAGTGLAIQGARMMLRGGARSDPGVATDPRGIATIERREPGRFDLQIWARGYETFRKAIDALPGETTDLETISLAREVTVQGRVLGLEDQPLAASFSLGIVDSKDHSIHWLRHEDWKSGGDGAFALRGLGRREYAIRTSNHEAVNQGEWEGIPWVSGNLLLDTRAGSISGLEVRLRPATKLVLHKAAGGADERRFRVVDDRGFELAAGCFDGSAPRPLQLPAGHYRVALLDPRGVVLSERRTTLGSQTVTLDLTRLLLPR